MLSVSLLLRAYSSLASNAILMCFVLGYLRKGQNCCPLRKTRIIVALKSCRGWIVAFCCNTCFAKKAEG